MGQSKWLHAKNGEEKKNTPGRVFKCLERERERGRNQSLGHQQQAPNKNL
jgi:hypothetical protein